MTYDRNRLPDASHFYESVGLELKGPRQSKWRTTNCEFHGGSDSMRVNITNGAFRCMNCGARGGDVIAYQMAVSGVDFISAAKAIGAWIDDGTPRKNFKPSALSPRAALEVLHFESTLVAIAAGNLAKTSFLTDRDRSRLIICASRIARITEDFAP